MFFSKASKAAVEWAKGAKVPFKEFAQTLEKIEDLSEKKKIDELGQFFTKVLDFSPEDLTACVYMSVNQLGPSYEGLELGIPEHSLIKAVAQVTGREINKIREDLRIKGDLGTVTQQARQNQKTLIQPKPLTIPIVFNKLVKIAKINGKKATSTNINEIKWLLSSCQGIEARFLVRMLTGKMRIGLGEESVLSALGHALKAYCDHNTPLTLAKLAESSKKVSGDKLDALKDVNVKRVKTAYGECPNIDRLIQVAITEGIDALVEKCKLTPGIPLERASGLSEDGKGISLRFQRFLRIRDDKNADNATSSEEALEMYKSQEIFENHKIELDEEEAGDDDVGKGEDKEYVEEEEENKTNALERSSRENPVEKTVSPKKEEKKSPEKSYPVKKESEKTTKSLVKYTPVEKKKTSARICSKLPRWIQVKLGSVQVKSMYEGDLKHEYQTIECARMDPDPDQIQPIEHAANIENRRILDLLHGAALALQDLADAADEANLNAMIDDEDEHALLNGANVNGVVQIPNQNGHDLNGVVQIPNQNGHDLNGVVQIPNQNGHDLNGAMNIPNQNGHDLNGAMNIPNQNGDEINGVVHIPNQHDLNGHGLERNPNRRFLNRRGVERNPNMRFLNRRGVERNQNRRVLNRNGLMNINRNGVEGLMNNNQEVHVLEVQEEVANGIRARQNSPDLD